MFNLHMILSDTVKMKEYQEVLFIYRVAIKMSSNDKFNLRCISFILITEKMNGIELNQVE